jgi:hypothetical protein
MLDLYIAYLPGNQPEFSVMRYSGTGADWSWTPLSGTEQIGANATLQGGIGQDFFVIACRYLDLGAAGQSTLGFFARSGIRMNNGGQYNDYVPSSGILSITLPVPESPSGALLLISALLVGTYLLRRKRIVKTILG